MMTAKQAFMKKGEMNGWLYKVCYNLLLQQKHDNHISIYIIIYTV